MFGTSSCFTILFLVGVSFFMVHAGSCQGSWTSMLRLQLLRSDELSYDGRHLQRADPGILSWFPYEHLQRLIGLKGQFEKIAMLQQ